MRDSVFALPILRTIRGFTNLRISGRRAGAPKKHFFGGGNFLEKALLFSNNSNDYCYYE